MSVLIKNMTLPKSCHTCRLMLLSPCQCALTGKSYNWGLVRRPRDCPLVEVSTPHGRLIDADALKTAFPTSESATNIKVSAVRRAINRMSTIIEAERKAAE